jgi:hypothetical protein
MRLLASKVQGSANGDDTPNDQSAQSFSPRFPVYSTLNQTNAGSKSNAKGFLTGEIIALLNVSE